MRTQTQYKALKNIGKKYVQRIFFSKAAGIPLQVYHFNKNGTSLQAFSMNLQFSALCGYFWKRQQHINAL